MSARHQTEASAVQRWADPDALGEVPLAQLPALLERHALADALRWLLALLAAEEDADEPGMPQRLLAACGEVFLALARCRGALPQEAVRSIEALLAALEPELARWRGALAPHRGGGANAAPASPPAPRPPLLDVAPPEASLPPQAALGASAPGRIVPGTTFVARFIVCAQDELAQLQGRLNEDAALDERRLRFDLSPVELSALTEVRLRLGPDLSAAAGETLVRQLHWNGALRSLEFDVVADALPASPVTQLAFFVEAKGVMIGRITLDLRFGTVSGATVQAQASLARRAFASYSSHDRDRVLDRVAALRIGAGMDVFVDCMDLAPGRAWQPRLAREISERELFMLFWSTAAQQSRWVKWEYEQALALQRPPGAMQVHPLENHVRAPRVLRHLHFDDPLNALRPAAGSTARP